MMVECPSTINFLKAVSFSTLGPSLWLRALPHLLVAFGIKFALLPKKLLTQSQRMTCTSCAWVSSGFPNEIQLHCSPGRGAHLASFVFVILFGGQLMGGADYEV
ncbi:hypothetical protein SUGI_1172630 [Cryptomeria japonica]|nr:hypothetical protein SUGI_1172630 [Cryptomeria japonica]